MATHVWQRFEKDPAAYNAFAEWLLLSPRPDMVLYCREKGYSKWASEWKWYIRAEAYDRHVGESIVIRRFPIYSASSLLMAKLLQTELERYLAVQAKTDFPGCVAPNVMMRMASEVRKTEESARKQDAVLSVAATSGEREVYDFVGRLSLEELRTLEALNEKARI